MALTIKGKYHYTDEQCDIPEELKGYSQQVGYPATHFAEAACVCRGRVFQVSFDDEAGAAVRVCRACDVLHPIGDSDEYLDEAELGKCECPCGSDSFEVTVGVSLYRGSDDVKWLYLGLRCVRCGLTACYGDWKNEYIGFHDLLQKV